MTSYYNYNWLLIRITIIFILFDGIRDNLIFSPYLSIMREFVFVVLVIQTIRSKFDLSGVVPTPMIAFLTFHTIISVYTILLHFFGGGVQYSLIIKPYFLLLAIYVFYYFEELTDRTYSDLVYFYVICSVCFVIINTLLYFIPCPFIENPHWWGRISVGYPTMDVVSLSYGLLFLFYYNNLRMNFIVRLFCIIVISLGIIIQASGTGLVLLLLIIVSAMLMSWRSKIVFKLFSGTIVAFLIAASSFLTYVSLNYPNEYRDANTLINNKISVLFGEDIENNTMEIRQQQFEKQAKSMNIIEQIFGKSLLNVSTGAFINKDSYMIEDEYNLLKVCYGYVGFSLFLLILVSYCFQIKKSAISANYKILFFLSVLVFLANSKTLITLLLFSNYMCFAFVYSMFKRMDNNYETCN